MADSMTPMQSNAALAPEPSHHNRGGIIAVVIIVALLVIAGGAYYFFSKTSLKIATQQPSLYMTVNLLPVSVVYKVDPVAKTLTPVTAPGQPQGTSVIGLVKDGDTTYYLIMAANTPTSNIYASVKGSSITQVTDSATFKYDISYDPSTHYFAYLSATIVSAGDLYSKAGKSQLNAMVAMVDGTGKATHEQLVAKNASGVQIVPQANFVIVEQPGALYAYNLFGGQSQKVYSLPPAHQAFAVSSTGTLAVFNVSTQSVDLFRAGNGLNGFSYLSSQKAPFAPSALGFDGSQLIFGAGGGAPSSYFSQLSLPGTSGVVQFVNPNQQRAAMPQQIFYE